MLQVCSLHNFLIKKLLTLIDRGVPTQSALLRPTSCLNPSIIYLTCSSLNLFGVANSLRVLLKCALRKKVYSRVTSVTISLWPRSSSNITGIFRIVYKRIMVYWAAQMANGLRMELVVMSEKIFRDLQTPIHKIDDWLAFRRVSRIASPIKSVITK